jgi:hypothetical protein
MNGRERFVAAMEYGSLDRVPNWEVGVWEQTKKRWADEGLVVDDYGWDWFVGEKAWDQDLREYIPVDFGMLPPFEEEVLERNERYEILRRKDGIVTKALLEGSVGGMRTSMDQFLDFPVKGPADWAAMKKRYDPSLRGRYPQGWKEFRLPGWRNREEVLVFGVNCSTLGFFWRAREWMGIEGLSYAWYDEPEMLHDMMETIADFTIAVARPILEEVAPDYVFINEDMSMKNGPLLSPDTYREFIFPRMKRLVDFFKASGVRYVAVDTDGNCEALIPLLMDAGVDAIWPLERAADMDPAALRARFGPSLRLWGGVDKRELAKDEAAIEAQLRSLAPLVEEGGFIPTVDHLVPPDVSLSNFRYYAKRKADLLAGRF